MYLELKDIKKSFGTGENRTQVLKGISCGIEKGRYVCYLDHQVQVNQHFLIS